MGMSSHGVEAVNGAALSVVQSLQGNKAKPLPEWKSQRIAEYIAISLDKPLRVETLATLSHMSISYFGRVFAASFSCPPHTYIMRARIERAKRLMLEGAIPLIEIALACGFADQAHLSRTFRERVGDTPGAWQRRHRHSAHPASGQRPTQHIRPGGGYDQPQIP